MLARADPNARYFTLSDEISQGGDSDFCGARPGSRDQTDFSVSRPRRILISRQLARLSSITGERAALLHLDDLRGEILLPRVLQGWLVRCRPRPWGNADFPGATPAPGTVRRLNPSFYPESQGAFAKRVRREAEARLERPCRLELGAQTEFAEPAARINTDLFHIAALSSKEAQAWDELVAYYTT
jgi:hypothetical protein